MAGNQGSVADSTASADDQVRSLLSSEALISWVGASASAFWTTVQPFPDQLQLLHDSYRDLGTALRTYSDALAAAQSGADGALYDARQVWNDLGVDPGILGGPLDSNAFRSRLVALISDRGLDSSHPNAVPDLSSARGKADEAQGDYERATSKCVAAIQLAADDAAQAIAIGGGVTFTDRFKALNGNPADLIFVAHEGQGLDAASLGNRDAEWLKQLLANPDSPASKAALELLGESLREHQADPAYLQAFFTDDGAASVASVLNRLAPGENQLLVPPSVKDGFPNKDGIANYAAGVAGASYYGDLGLIKLPANVWEPLFNGPHYTVPFALLAAYGPNGQYWGSKLLARGGTTVLQFQGTDLAVKDSMWGLAPDVLARIGESGDASRELQDPAASSNDAVTSNLQKLLSGNYWMPGKATDGVAAEIIHNATTDLSEHSDASARATLALFNSLDGTALRPNLAMAVSQAGAAHLDLLMADTGHVMEAGSTLPDGVIPIPQEQVDVVLKSFAGDRAAAANLNGAIAQRALVVTRAGDFGVGNSPSQALADMQSIKDLGSLQGALDTHRQQSLVDGAHRTDHVNTVRQAWIEAVFGGASSIAIENSDVEEKFQEATGAMSSAAPFYESFFPTDTAAQQIDQSSFTLSADRSALDVPIIQGLIDRGKVQPPPGAAWYNMRTGMVDVSAPDARNAFVEWYRTNRSDGATLARALSGAATAGYDLNRSWSLK